MDDVAQHLKVSRRLLDLRFREITGRTMLAAIQAVSSARLEAVLDQRHHRRTAFDRPQSGKRRNALEETSSVCVFHGEYYTIIT